MEPSPRSNQSEKPSQPDDISGQLNRLKLTNDPREILKSFLGRTLRIVITDGRVIFGDFVCTDRDANIILENSLEYISEEVEEKSEPRALGPALIKGEHIITISIFVPVQ